MCAELFRIPITVGGIPLFGIGLLLILWIGLGGIAVVRNQRKGRPALEGWASWAVGAAAIVFFPRVFPDGFPIRSYGLMLLCGSSLGLTMAVYRARQQGIDAEQILSLAMGMFVCGIIGARLFYVIEYWEARIQQPTLLGTIQQALSYTEGGLVVYGSLIGATLAFLWFCRRSRFPPLALADLIAPSLAAGLALGRIGCLMNGCCYGGPTDVPYAVSFPRYSIPPRGDRPGHLSGAYYEQYGEGLWYGLRIGAAEGSRQPVITHILPDSAAEQAGLTAGEAVVGVDRMATDNVEAVQGMLSAALRAGEPVTLHTDDGRTYQLDPGVPPPRSRPVHPTQIYSAINAGLLAWLLWTAYPFRRTDGQVTALMLTAYPIARFLLEDIRIDESAVFGTGLSISQNISIVLLVSATGLWLYLWQSPRRLFDFRRSPPKSR